MSLPGAALARYGIMVRTAREIFGCIGECADRCSPHWESNFGKHRTLACIFTLCVSCLCCAECALLTIRLRCACLLHAGKLAPQAGEAVRGPLVQIERHVVLLPLGCTYSWGAHRVFTMPATAAGLCQPWFLFVGFGADTVHDCPATACLLLGSH